MLALCCSRHCIVATDVAGDLLASSLLAAVLLLPLPMVLWAAVRYGEKGASGAILIVAVFMTWRTLRGTGLFPGEEPERTVLALQMFLMGLSIPLLLLGALIDELRRAEGTTRGSRPRCCGCRTRSGGGSRATCTTARARTSSPPP